MAAMGVRSSWDASAMNRRSRASDSRESLLGCHPGPECRLDPGQHDVEGAGQAADFGGLVLARHALGKVPLGDRLRGRLHVAGGDGGRCGRARNRRGAATITAPPVTISSMGKRWCSVLSVSPSGAATIR